MLAFPAFPAIITDFGGSTTNAGNTGPFWIGSGLAVLNILITLALIRPVMHNGMEDEDEKFRAYLIEHGYDASLLGLGSETDSTKDTDEKISSQEDIELPSA